MPSRLVYDKKEKIFRSRFWGVVVETDILNLAGQIMTHPEFQRHKLELVDLTDIVSIDLSEQSFRLLVQFYHRDLALFMGYRKAFVCPTDLAFGMARMYSTISDVTDSPIKIGVYRSEEEALEWLCGKPDKR